MNIAIMEEVKLSKDHMKVRKYQTLVMLFHPLL